MGAKLCPMQVKTQGGWQQRVGGAAKSTSATAGRCHSATIGDVWVAAARNQKRPFVVNALLAAYEAKRFLVGDFGERACCLGTVGVEQNWWFDEIHDARNLTGVWASNAARQYRAVVKWKTQVEPRLREHCTRIGGATVNAEAQTASETCEVLCALFNGSKRSPLLHQSGGPSEPRDDERAF